MQSRRFLAPALLAAALLTGCLSLGAGDPTQDVAIDEKQALASVNAFRAANGLGPVSPDPQLTQAAAIHSRRMASVQDLSHSLGGALPRRLGAVGYTRWSAAAENIGKGYMTYGAAMAGWIDSPGHRKNLLNPAVDRIGVAAAQPEGRTYPRYWTMILAKPD